MERPPLRNRNPGVRRIPGAYEKGKVIDGIADAETGDAAIVFQAGTRLDGGLLVTNGGRVLAVTALGDTIPATIDRAYAGVAKISFEGAHYRKDIGEKAMKRL